MFCVDPLDDKCIRNNLQVFCLCVWKLEGVILVWQAASLTAHAQSTRQQQHHAKASAKIKRHKKTKQKQQSCHKRDPQLNSRGSKIHTYTHTHTQGAEKNKRAARQTHRWEWKDSDTWWGRERRATRHMNTLYHMWNTHTHAQVESLHRTGAHSTHTVVWWWGEGANSPWVWSRTLVQSGRS